MQEKKQLQKTRKKVPFAAIGILLVIASMLLLVRVDTANSWQADPAIYPEAYFEGRYRIGDGEWKPVVKGAHIPSTKGDVTLQGQFHLVVPDGEYLGVAEAGTPMAFYINHMHITVQEPGQPPYEMDMENVQSGKSMCGRNSEVYVLSTGEPVTLVFHNPHRYGNETAIDEFLEELAVYADATYEKEFMAQGSTERNAGLLFVVVAFLILGTALLSVLLQIEGSGRLWMIGLCILFAGGYFAYGAKGVFFWRDSIIESTTVLGACMMLYLLGICVLTTSVLRGKMCKIGKIAVLFLELGCLAIAVTCLATDVRFYDTWFWWVLLQSVVNLIFLCCLAMSLAGATKKQIFGILGAVVVLLGFEIDVAATALGWWREGLLCKHIFAMMFVALMVLTWQIIPRNINAARKAKEMEAEQKEIRAQLQENRVAIMISQIQPHFIYNTLGTIQYLCKEDPEQASRLVHNFSVYLRGNFSELDNTVPIRFLKELEHVRCYTDIELVRFPDMTVHYDIQAEEFLLPALTVQPLVENAIKHGLMGREEGGTVTVTTFETQTHYCVKVADDGVGFDVNIEQDARKHVGIRNVRERLQMMCGGTLTVESQIGSGTTALIQIPKEGKKQ